MIHRNFAFGCFLLGTALVATGQALPRAAVWDPERDTPHQRFSIVRGEFQKLAATLNARGITTDLLTTGQINDASRFNAKNYDALILCGGVFPKENLPAYERFADAGGVLVEAGSKVPFLIQLSRAADGAWQPEPQSPQFAWQTGRVLKLFDLSYVYEPSMHDRAYEHLATGLLKKFQPNAPDIHNRRLEAWWLVPKGDGSTPSEIYPLIRSVRPDGLDATPQIFIARCGKRTGLFSLNKRYTLGGEPAVWPHPEETLVAMVRLCHALRNDAALLKKSAAVNVVTEVIKLKTLENFGVGKSVNPENHAALARFGEFNGSLQELGPDLKKNETRRIAPGRDTLPARLHEGAKISFTVPRSNAPRFLRIRGAVENAGPVLTVRGDAGRVVWNERFTLPDASGKGNHGAPDLKGRPLVFNRIFFIPEGDAIEISNTGTGAIFFDAVQVETHAAPRGWIIGLNYGHQGGWAKSTPVPKEIYQTWHQLRVNPRTQQIGPPGNPDAWKSFEKMIELPMSMVPKIDMLFEGTAEWFAINPERYALGKSKNRPHCTAPDPEKYAAIAAHVAEKYGDRIRAYEIWNEAESGHFYYGSHDEYVNLYKAMVKAIRAKDPGAHIITTGMAGFHEDFINTLAGAGVLDDADTFAFHPYAGKSPGWDIAFGQLESALYAYGSDIEVFCNESGFVWRNSEWFTTPPVYNEHLQMRLLDMATARLLASGVNKLCVFHAGGDDSPFGLIDQKGRPRAAYKVFDDYLQLAHNNGTRLDAAMSRADGQPLEGVYLAGAQHDDGSITLVINPAEVPGLVEAPDAAPGAEPWRHGTTFFGKMARAAQGVVLTPDAGKDYVGYHWDMPVDPRQTDTLTLATETDGTWSLTVENGTEKTELAKDAKTGETILDLRTLKLMRPADLRFTLRATNPLTLNSATAALRHPVAEGLSVPQDPQFIPVRLLVPLPTAGAWQASTLATIGGVEKTETPRLVLHPGYAEVSHDLKTRTRLRLVPQK